MVEEDEVATWSTFRSEAPQLADAIRSRFDAHLHHVLGTVRASGAPRLSGTEVQFDDEHVTIGMMAGAHKLADVRRDPRAEIHSAPIDEKLNEGDAKLGGVLVHAGDVDGPVGGSMFYLHIKHASLVRVADNELVFSTWSRSYGEREIRRR